MRAFADPKRASRTESQHKKNGTFETSRICVASVRPARKSAQSQCAICRMCFGIASICRKWSFAWTNVTKFINGSIYIRAVVTVLESRAAGLCLQILRWSAGFLFTKRHPPNGFLGPPPFRRLPLSLTSETRDTHWRQTFLLRFMHSSSWLTSCLDFPIVPTFQNKNFENKNRIIGFNKIWM